MTAEEKYFISLISSFLNKTTPEIPKNVDWNKIYRLSEIHNVTAIIASGISKLPEEFRPNKKLYSSFRQQLGYTLINYDDKIKAYNYIKELLTENEIEYLFIKGIVLNKLYPVKEFRTCGDIDVIIKDKYFDRLKSILKKKGIKITEESAICLNFEYNKIQIEAHSNLYSDHKYFDNIFELAEKNGFEYTLSYENHLLYVLCHIVKHFKMCGAGIRMFMDIDVLIRKIDSCIDYNQFFTVCKELNIYYFAKFSFFLCNNWFLTPKTVNSGINIDKNILDLLENEILSGGSFGFQRRGLADYYLSKGSSGSEKNNFAAKLKAVVSLFFPKKEYLYSVYPYAKKHHFLLPAAWFERLFKAVFVRRKHSLNTMSSIIHSDEKALQYKKLLNELDI